MGLSGPIIFVVFEEEEKEEEEEERRGGEEREVPQQKQKPHNTMWGNKSQLCSSHHRKVSIKCETAKRLSQTIL